MFSEGRVTERWRLLALLLIATLVGMVTEHLTLCYLLALALYLIWHIRQFNRVERWLAAKGGEDEAPLVLGIWDDFINHLFRQEKHYQKEIERYETIVTRFQDTVNALPDATVVLGEHGDIRWANPAAERYLGIRNPGDIGQRLSNLIRDVAFVEFLAKDHVGKSINIISPLDDEVHLNVRVAPYRGGIERLVTARDISDLIRADQMRRDFVSNASHELKTPLTVMSGYMELLEGTPELDQDLLSVVRSADEQTARMRRLVDDLLTLSRLESNTQARFEPIMVAAILETVVEDAIHLSGDRDHDVGLSADRELIIDGVYSDLVSALSNLVFNAVNHTPDGSVVRVSWQREGDEAVLRVKDNGLGIEPRHLPRLTERFYRAQAGRERDHSSARQGRGTGLGLAIVKHIVQAHGGRLSIQSTPGEGAEFVCYFPLKTNR
ncbi:phosphate regulon sensor kinase PhoR [gamma proteobacterium HTCC5015]|nr:phosphate regulon sensor kinase PhoR [gamma proteobacterium HTCC5015]